MSDFHHHVAHLPPIIQRNFEAIGRLDSEGTQLLRNVEEQAKVVRTSAEDFVREKKENSSKKRSDSKSQPPVKSGKKGKRKRDTTTDEKLLGAVTKLWRTLNKQSALNTQLGDEKLRLAQQSYDILDTHVRRVDEELKRMEEVLHRNNMLPKEANAKGRGGGFHKRKRSGSVAPAFLDTLPEDPNEPIYCVCRDISHGEMVACDDEQCDVEWFHLHCVGLSHLPTGKWICDACTERREAEG